MEWRKGKGRSNSHPVPQKPLTRMTGPPPPPPRENNTSCKCKRVAPDKDFKKNNLKKKKKSRHNLPHLHDQLKDKA